MNARTTRLAAVAAALALWGAAPAWSQAPAPAAAAATNDLPNFQKVSDTLYRGAQPGEAGFRQLEAMGVRTVINLRAFHSDRDELKGTRLDYASIPINTWSAEPDDIVRFLRVAMDTNRQPIFVHCQHGADRTGLMCAMYRIFACGWPRDRAVDEMISGGYGFHPLWTNLVKLAQSIDTNVVWRQLAVPAKP